MEIPPSQISPGSGGGLTLGTPIPANLADNLLSTVSVTGLPPELLRPQVIEAVVLRNTLLPSPPRGAATTPQPSAPLPATATGGMPQPGGPATSLPNLPRLQVATTAPLAALVRIALQWQGKTFEVISPQPLPPGTPLQIQVGNRNELVLRNTSLAVKGTIIASATNMLNQALPSSTSTPTTMSTTSSTSVAASSPASSPTVASTATSGQIPSMPPLRERVLQLIQPLIRENLPRQQPLMTMLPVLRTLIHPAQLEKMPQPLARALLNLWQTLPTPQKLQHPATLKQALRDSGSFFEARAQLARAIAQEQPQALPRVLGTDLKAQIIVLLTLLRSRPPAPPAMPAAAGPDGKPNASQVPASDEATYTRPTSRPAAAIQQATGTEETIDTLLQQLGRTLEASLSRIHLNQLDSILSRHTGADPAQTIPTWVLEMPVQTAHGREQVNLRIEEHARRQDNKRSKQWLVQLGFDLHELGKLAATLTIAGHRVAATLWAEREQTHRTVAREMASLRAGLESVGVNVTEMQCRLGVPPERNGLLNQRLVDTHS